MILPAILDPFAEQSAPALMIRLAFSWTLPRAEVAEVQYGREFLLGHLVEVMADVSCGFRASPRSAFLKRRFDRIASPDGSNTANE